MDNIKALTQKELFENIDLLRYDDNFLENIDFFLARATEDVNIDLMRLLLSCGASPNVNGWGDVESLLHGLVHAYGMERELKGERIIEAAKLLLEYGANPDISGANNLTPIQVAQSLKANDFKAIFVAYGANPTGNEIR